MVARKRDCGAGERTGEKCEQNRQMLPYSKLTSLTTLSEALAHHFALIIVSARGEKKGGRNERM